MWFLIVVSSLVVTSIAIAQNNKVYTDSSTQCVEDGVSKCDDGCDSNTPAGTCTPGETYCLTTATGDCQYACQGDDGGVGAWSSGVKCASGRTCDAQGLGGKCKKT